MAVEPLDVVVSLSPCRPGRVTCGRSARQRLHRLLGSWGPLLRQALLPLSWLLCLLGGAKAGLDLHSFGWLWDNQLELAIGSILVLIAGAALLRDQLRAGARGADPGPPLAALALLLWHLGIPASPESPERWCMAVVKASGSSEPPSLVDSHTVVGLMLLDDMVRTVLRFVASTPVTAWPFALLNKRSHFLWVHDEEWWAACYRGAGWMRLPGGSELLVGGRPQRPGGCVRRLMREAALWASAMAETLGMMVVLRPRCAAPCWTAAPCVASALLLVSCSPWMPRQSELVFIEMMRLMHAVSKFAIYFQAVWMLALGALMQPEDIALCALPKESAVLRLLEAGALVALYVTVAGRLWLATTRCRIAAPLYAVPTEEVVADPPLRSRPLYCGSLGLVEGSYAPTRVFDWEDLGSDGRRVSWRDRYALRRCADLLAAREAHLLSCLDALDVRIGEAELEVHGAKRHASQLSLLGRHHWLAGLWTIALCLLLAHGLQPLRCAHALSSVPGGGRVLEGVLYATLLLRVARDWYSLMANSLAPREATDHVCYGEVAALRRQSHALHQSLAQAQHALGRLETRLESLGVTPMRPSRCAATGDPSRTSSGTILALLFGWLASLFALPFLPEAV